MDGHSSSVVFSSLLKEVLFAIVGAYPAHSYQLLNTLESYANRSFKRSLVQANLEDIAKEHGLSYDASDILDAVDTVVGNGSAKSRLGKWTKFRKDLKKKRRKRRMPVALVDSLSANASSLTQDSSQTIWSKMAKFVSKLNCSVNLFGVAEARCGDAPASGVRSSFINVERLGVGDCVNGNVTIVKSDEEAVEMIDQGE